MIQKSHKNMFEHLAATTELQITLELHGIELHESTYTWIFLNKSCKCILFSL